MTNEQIEMLKAVREHAQKNYNKGGWDYIIECYEDDAELLELCGDATTPKQAIAIVKKCVGNWADRREDIEKEVF